MNLNITEANNLLETINKQSLSILYWNFEQNTPLETQKIDYLEFSPKRMKKMSEENLEPLSPIRRRNSFSLKGK